MFFVLETKHNLIDILLTICIKYYIINSLPQRVAQNGNRLNIRFKLMGGICTMKTWNTNEIRLEGAWLTNVRLQGSNLYHQTANQLKCVSIPKYSVITFVIGGPEYGLSDEDLETISKRLSDLSDKWNLKLSFKPEVDSVKGGHSFLFKVCLKLKKSFTEDTLNFLEDFLKVFACNDSTIGINENLRQLVFDDVRTLYRQGEGFIGYGQWVRFNKGLIDFSELHYEFMPNIHPLA